MEKPAGWCGGIFRVYIYIWCSDPFKPQHSFPDGVDTCAAENGGSAGDRKWRAFKKLCGIFPGTISDFLKYEHRKRKICSGRAWQGTK